MSLGNFISHTTCFSTLGNLEIWSSGKRLEKVSFHSNPKERHCHVQLPHNCTHFTCSQSIFQIPPSEPSILHKLITSRSLIWILKRQRNWSSNCQHLLDHRKSKRIPEKQLLLLHWLWKSLGLCESLQTVEISQRDGNTRPSYLPPEKPLCRLRSNN